VRVGDARVEKCRARRTSAKIARAGVRLNSRRVRRTERSTCNHSANPCGHNIIISIIQEVECVGIRGGSGHLVKGKHGLIEDDMARYDDPVGMKVETSIPFMIGRITKEDTQRRARR
jgi:hypothetical protein